jgi:hypothetical protein
MSATENGLYVYSVTYSTNTPGTLTIGTQVTQGTNNGTISITAPSNELSNADTGATNLSVDDTTLNVQNKYIGTVNLPGGVQGFLVQDTGNKNYYIFTTSTLPAADVGKNVSATVNVSTGTATTGTAGLANWDITSTTTGKPFCFLEGTNIRTPSGDAAIETLQIGDLVITLEAGAEVARPVIWVGHRSIKPGDLTGDDAHPVRIKAGAFADGIPVRDLLVTPEHCIFADGGLIPAHLLVNHRSILVDAAISSFTYYHIELETHAILLAEGLAAESYLDTGNRGIFVNAEVAALRPALALNASHKSWADAAAPLMVARDQVEPVWQALNERALQAGLPRLAAAQTLPADADVHLVSDQGAVIWPLSFDGGKAMFMIPPGAGELSLISNTARPCDMIAPFIDDRRALGVLVGKVSLHQGRREARIIAHLAADGLPGWYAREHAGRRWTGGKALLPVSLNGLSGPSILEIEILQAGADLAEKGRAAA